MDMFDEYHTCHFKEKRSNSNMQMKDTLVRQNPSSISDKNDFFVGLYWPSDWKTCRKVLQKSWCKIEVDKLIDYISINNSLFHWVIIIF